MKEEQSTGKEAAADRPFLERIAKVFSDPIRMKILAEASVRPISSTLFFEQFGGGSVTRVKRHFDLLAEAGWLGKVAEKTGGERRGAIEHFYRTKELPIFDNSTWAELPAGLRRTFSWHIFETLADQVKAALEAGTFDSRPERHFSWTHLHLDQAGWERVVGEADDLFDLVFEEQRAAHERMEQSGERPIRVTVALAAFESPSDEERLP